MKESQLVSLDFIVSSPFRAFLSSQKVEIVPNPNHNKCSLPKRVNSVVIQIS